MFRPIVHGGGFDPGAYNLDPKHVDWLKEVLPPNAKSADIDRLEKAGGLTDDQRSVLIGLRRSFEGILRSEPSTAFGKDGKLDPNVRKVWTLRGARVPTHNMSAAEAFKTKLNPYLIGQGDALPDFERFRLAQSSMGRQVSPLMVIGGDIGHGKEEALEGLAKAMCGEDAKVIAVDVSTIDDSNYQDWFLAGGKVGTLSPSNLMEIEDNKHGVVRLYGLEKLKERAPVVAKELLKRLGAQRDEAGYARVPFILDFDVPPEANLKQILEDALGPVATRLRAAQTMFDHLDTDAMRQYLEIAVPQILAQPGMGKVQIEWANDAKQLFAEILATPHEPLLDLQARLQTLVLDMFDGADSVAHDAVLRVHVAPELKVDDPKYSPRRREEIIELLRSPDVDLLEVPRIFHVFEEGRVAAPELIAGLIEDSEQIVDKLQQRAVHHESEIGRIFPEYHRVEQLAETLGEIETALRLRARAKGADVLDPDQSGIIQATRKAETLLAQLVGAGAARLAEVDLPFDANVAISLKAALEAVRLIGRAPNVVKGDEAGAEALRTFSTQVAGAAGMIRQLKDKLPLGQMFDNRITHRLAAFSKLWMDAIQSAKSAAREELYPLLLEDEAQTLIDAAKRLKAWLPLGDLKTAERSTAMRRFFESSPEARKDLKGLAKLIDLTVQTAEELGGLSKTQRKSIVEARAEEMTDTPQLRRELARKLIRTENGATEVDARVVQSELVRLPVGVLERLERLKIPVVVMRGKITEFLTDLPKGQRPPGYPEGRTYDDVPAIFVNGDKRGPMVIIVTKEQNGNVILPGLDPDRGQNSVVHEVMHAIDIESFFSGTPEFQSIREAERAALSEYEKQAKEGNFDRGAAETWAITGERLYGGDPKVRKERPGLVGFLEAKTNKKKGS